MQWTCDALHRFEDYTPLTLKINIILTQTPLTVSSLVCKLTVSREKQFLKEQKIYQSYLHRDWSVKALHVLLENNINVTKLFVATWNSCVFYYPRMKFISIHYSAAVLSPPNIQSLAWWGYFLHFSVRQTWITWQFEAFSSFTFNTHFY